MAVVVTTHEGGAEKVLAVQELVVSIPTAKSNVFT